MHTFIASRKIDRRITSKCSARRLPLRRLQGPPNGHELREKEVLPVDVLVVLAAREILLPPWAGGIAVSVSRGDAKCRDSRLTSAG